MEIHQGWIQVLTSVPWHGMVWHCFCVWVWPSPPPHIIKNRHDGVFHHFSWHWTGAMSVFRNWHTISPKKKHRAQRGVAATSSTPQPEDAVRTSEYYGYSESLTVLSMPLNVQLLLCVFQWCIFGDPSSGNAILINARLVMNPLSLICAWGTKLLFAICCL